LLIENGTGINKQGEFHGTALQAAFARGHRETVQLLLENGADLGRYHGTALNAASQQDHKEVVQLLLDNEADIGRTLTVSVATMARRSIRLHSWAGGPALS
ncbi:hypothetical protein C8R43DRAFT_889325, partial [Mycena crocata]